MGDDCRTMTPTDESLTSTEFVNDMTTDVHHITGDALAEARTEKDFHVLIYIVAIIGALFAIFQAIKIYTDHTADGVSMAFWLGYLVIAGAWFGYGIYYKNKPIIAAYSIWIIVEIVILNGIYLYG